MDASIVVRFGQETRHVWERTKGRCFASGFSEGCRSQDRCFQVRRPQDRDVQAGFKAGLEARPKVDRQAAPKSCEIGSLVRHG